MTLEKNVHVIFFTPGSKVKLAASTALKIHLKVVNSLEILFVRFRARFMNFKAIIICLYLFYSMRLLEGISLCFSLLPSHESCIKTYIYDCFILESLVSFSRKPMNKWGRERKVCCC